MDPKVSVIIPVYNVEKYLRECLDSVVNQTLKDIEIICVNDGSTDSSPDILKEYAAQDDRIVLIEKENAGYGAAMNDGLDAARGEYIAFLESDDAISENAYERLCILANEHHVDIVKGDYYEMSGIGDAKRLDYQNLCTKKTLYNQVFCPRSAHWSFYVPMMNCIGVFRRDMLKRNSIRFNETPGASHQDLGFWFQSFCCAEKVLFVDEAFYQYRQDNESSSMKDDTKAFFVKGEYDLIRVFLDKHPSLKKDILSVFLHRKFSSCLFAYSKAELSIKLPFIRALADDYREDYRTGLLTFARFNDFEKQVLLEIMNDPDAYYLTSLDKKCRGTNDAIAKLENEISRLHGLQLLGETADNTPEIDYTQHGSDSPLISVIIPVYNTEKYLEKCLDSILDQSFEDFEILCMDDGSSDRSLAILDEYAERDNRVKVLRRTHQGQGAARNEGMRIARGAYVQFVDSDDYLLQGAFEIPVSRMEADQLDILLFDGTTVYDTPELADAFGSMRNRYKRSRSYKSICKGSDMFVDLAREGAFHFQPCMALYRKEFLFRHSVFFPVGIIYEDNVFVAKSILFAERTGHVNEAYYARRVREGSTITSIESSFNVLSYYRVYLELTELALTHTLEQEAEHYLNKEICAIVRIINRMFNNLPSIEKDIVLAMPPIRRSMLERLLGQGNSSTKAELEKAKAKIEKLYASNSWKAGRMLTALPRFLKRSLKH